MSRPTSSSPSAGSESTSGPGRRVLLGAFALGHLSNDCAPGAIWLIAPAVAAAMGLAPSQVGLLLTIHGIGAALAYVPAGMLTDQIPRRGPLLLATFWWTAAGYVLASFAPDFAMLSLLLAIAVIGDAAWHPIATGVLVQRFPGQRAQVLGIHAMGGTIGAEVIAPLGVGFALTFLDWRAVMALSALPALLMGLAFIPVARGLGECARRAPAPGELTALLRRWVGPQGRRFVVVVALYNMAFMAMLSMTPLFLQTERGYTSWEAGVVFAVMLLVGSLAQPLVGRLSDRIGRKRLMTFGIAGGGGAAALTSVATSDLTILVGLVLAAGFLTAIRSVVLAAAVELSARREATTLGFAFSIMDGVGALGALLGGMVGDVRLSGAFALAAALCAVASLAAMRLDLHGDDPVAIPGSAP